jgi:hypothetical protein
MTTAKVYEAIARVTAELSKVGIEKNRKNVQQGYSFRGIDDVYCALSPLLAKHQLCILPRVMSREQVERTTAKGGVLFYTTVHMEFDMVSAEDGSKHTISMVGEAMDSGDKSSNKAMSAAYKYAAMQTFAIPTEGDNDADSTTHEVQAIPGLSASILKRHTDAIAAAKDMDALKTAYTTAYKAAHAVKDAVAEEILAEAKDSRKTELEVTA